MDWKGLEAMVDKTVLGMFSERLELLPYAATSPNGPASPDASRTSLVLTAVLYWPDDKAVIAASPSFHTKVEASPARVAINRQDYPDLVIRRGDFLRALDRPEQPTLKVGKVAADHRDLIILEIAQGGIK
jgi:hypothetical protein